MVIQKKQSHTSLGYEEISYRLKDIELFAAVSVAKKIIVVFAKTGCCIYAAESQESALAEFKNGNLAREPVGDIGEIDAEEFLLENLSPPDWERKELKKSNFVEREIIGNGEKIAVAEISGDAITDFNLLKEISEKEDIKAIRNYALGGGPPAFWWFWNNYRELSSNPLWRPIQMERQRKQG